MADPTQARRQLAARKLPIFHKIAHFLIRIHLTPNQVSVLSVAFGIMAGVCLFEAPRAGSSGLAIMFLILAIVGIQMRLFCNLIDGLMAVEGGLKTAYGEIFNDFPDRLSDIAIILGAGYACAAKFSWSIELGWLAALLAVMTAYTRVLGAACKTPHYFIGPTAKQHRMFLLTLACLGSIYEITQQSWGYSITVVLMIICAGSAVTCLRRLTRIVNYLKTNSI